VLPLSGVTHMAAQEDVAANLLRLEVAFVRTSLGIA
jgi:dipeptidyl-peptidase 4